MRSSLFQPREHLAFGLEPLVGVVLQHPSREMPRDCLDDVLRFAGFEKIGDDRVSEGVEPEACQASGVPQRAPGSVPLAPWLRRLKLVMLVRAPNVVTRIFVTKIVSALQHALKGLPRRLI